MSKVVTFSRSANYLHQRAMRNRRASNMLDALDLMRRALEREPDNLEYKMDLAELFCEMGCHRQSNRLLLEILISSEPLGECYFGMSCNYIGLRDMEAAYSLMMRFLSGDPEAIERPEVNETLASLLLARNRSRAHGRRPLRAERFYERGAALLRTKQLEKGAVMLARSLEVHPVQQAGALLAICQLMLGEPERALRQIGRALKLGVPEFMTRAVAAQVFSAAGHEHDAHEQLEWMLGRERDEEEDRLLLDVTMRLGLDKLVHTLSTGALKTAPYDASLLHAKAVSLINLGHPQDEAKRYWDRANRIDPGDTISQFYSAMCEKGQLTGARLSYERQVTGEELSRRTETLLKTLRNGRENAVESWENAKRFRNLIGWALDTGNITLQGAALALLGPIERPDAELLLREYLLRPEVSGAQKAEALNILLSHGVRKPYLVMDGDGRLADWPDGRARNRQLRPGHRRVLGIVARAQQSREYRSAGLVEALLRRYIRCSRRPPRIHMPAAWSAALVALRLKLMDSPDAVRLLSTVFQCSPRMIVHCAHRIERVLKEDDQVEAD